MSHIEGARQAQKRRTRQALLDAALGLLEEQSLSGLGLRELTRAVGISPAAFYRHFADMGELGVALVEESLGNLHDLVTSVLLRSGEAEDRIDRTVEVVLRHVREHPSHVRFVARERHGGVRPVRLAIAAQLGRFAEEVAAVLTEQPQSRGWSPSDVRMLAELYVDRLVMTATAMLEAQDDEPDMVGSIVDSARRQMRLVSIGRRHWLSDTETRAGTEVEAEVEAETAPVTGSGADTGPDLGVDPAPGPSPDPGPGPDPGPDRGPGAGG
ncbi:TetR family transcriptional regulator [Streptomyces sp. NPDC059740]|uniref:TetR family transcriptional regulator n=1 Tax=Streptomyces sp. NPDC059740 TaxID=3346926 RepID=UPI0036618540